MKKDNERNNCVLTVKETAELLKVSKSLIYRLLKKESLPAIKVGRQWRILKKDLFEIRR